MPEFKVPKTDGIERRDSTVSISIPDLVKFNKIKGYLSFKSASNIESQQVVHELIQAWIKQNGVVGDSS